MLWKSREKAIENELRTRLAPCSKTLGLVDAARAAHELMDNVLVFDMSRSSTRLRRRIYGAWGKYQLAQGELVMLTPRGVKARDVKIPDPDEVGDVHIDLTRLFAWLRTRFPKSKDGSELVQVATVVIESVGKHTAQANTPVQKLDVAALCGLGVPEEQALSSKMKRAALASAVQRRAPRWGLGAAEPKAVESTVDALIRRGALKSEAPDKLSLARLSFAF